MLTKVTIKNYKSIYNSSVDLSPFTLLIGANGTGKSNFINLLKNISFPQTTNPIKKKSLFLSLKHLSFHQEDQKISITNSSKTQYLLANGLDRSPPLPELSDVRIFSLNPHNAGISEQLVASPSVQEDGAGIVQVLDALKTGDREDLFKKVEDTLKLYIPEVEKLSFIPARATKGLQVREQYLPKPIPVSSLSEGTQLTLILIAILYQENPPSLICIEDIDRGLHPRLFQQIIQLCFDLSSQENGPQIIATTHNPYLVDEFKDHESAVVIVEKEEGKTTFTTLADRLANLDADEEPLGSLWYSGFVGGIPQRSI